MNSTTLYHLERNPGTLNLGAISSVLHSQLMAGLALTVAAIAFISFSKLPAPKNIGVKRIHLWPFFGQWDFFTRRHGRVFSPLANVGFRQVFSDYFRKDFLLEGFNKFPQERLFGFRLLGHEVVALRGEAARKVFFGSGELGFMDGYSVLFGGTPDTKDIGQDQTQRTDRELALFLRHMAVLFNSERIAELSPILISDLQRYMGGWGQAGKFDPFQVMYSIVFRLTIRAAAAREIADSVEKCDRLEKLYWKVERGNTAASLLLPWFPSVARIQKLAATIKIFSMLNNIIKTRRREGRREQDALQKFIDRGDSTADVIGFTMGILFAGIVNTGTTSSWIFVFLDQAPQWQERVVEEIRAMLDKYAPGSEGPYSVMARFSKVPLQAWEDEMPILDACIKETIRLVLSRTALRRVIAGDITIGGKDISNGTFLAYPMGETHMDSDIYPNPTQYDPGRYFDGQGKAQTYGFLGWGAGRHPCAGRRFAQYTIKSMVAMFLASYTYEMIDASGKKLDPSVTISAKNDLYRITPLGQTLFMKYTERKQLI